MSSSGGGSGIASDRVTEEGMSLAPLTPETLRELDRILLPPQARNPIDLGGRKVPESVEIAGDATRILLSDPTVGYGLAVLTSMPFYAKRATLIGEAARASGKPTVVVFTPGAAAVPGRQSLRELGLFTFNN